MKIKKTALAVTDICAVALFVYLLAFPKIAAEPTRQALEFCFNTLIPALFVYMVLAKTVVSLPVTDKLTRILGIETFALLIGTLCGCPVGAKNAVSLFESGRISKRQAEYLCSFTNNAGVSFVVGFVGGELFGDIRIGIKLLIFQLVSAVVTAAVMRRIMFKKEKMPPPLPRRPAKTGLKEAISDSATTMINLCACAVFFMVAGGAITRIFNLPNFWDSILKSVLEFSSGCAAAARLGKASLPIAAFAIGQTGLSVAMQVKSVAGNKLSLKPYFMGKGIFCAVMTGLAIFCG